MRHVFFSLLLCASFVAGSLQAGDSYAELQQAIGQHPHRLPGSKHFAAAAEILTQFLTSRGLKVERQTYGTLVPETRLCSLEIDGKHVDGVLALGPNGFANNTTGGQTITGPVVWLGDGGLKAMDGKPVAGSIAVLRFDSPNMGLVFSQGASAVVFVGDGSESQWTLRHQFTEMPMTVPRAFVGDEAAKKYGLISEKPIVGQGVFQITTVWKDAVASNLWTKIPGRGKTKEAVVLAATLDTFGVVPERCPGSRTAANVALLATVATELQNKPLNRDVLIAFFGSHYAAQDGARHFYYAVDKAEDKTSDALSGRLKGYETQIKVIDEQCALLEGDLLGSDHPLRTRTIALLRQKLAARVANANYHIQTQMASLHRKSATLDQDEVKHLQAVVENHKAVKKVWNGLRSQISLGKITDMENYRSLVAEIAKELRASRQDFTNRKAHNLTFQTLAKVVAGKRIVGHFGFDFASGDKDWLFNPIGAPEILFYHSLLAISLPTIIPYQRHIRALASLGKQQGPRPFAENLESLLSPDAFCMPGRRSTAATVASHVQVPGYQLISLGADLGRDETPYPERVDLSPLVGPMTAFCTDLANDETVSRQVALRRFPNDRRMVFYFEGDSIFGSQFTNYSFGGGELEGPARNAIAGAYSRGLEKETLAGHTRIALTRINRAGYIFSPTLYQNSPCQSFGYNAQGEINRLPINEGFASYRSFYGYGGGLFLPLLAESYQTLNGKLLNGLSDSTFKNNLTQAAPGQAVLYADRKARIKLIGDILLLGGDEAKPEGFGIDGSRQSLLSFNAVRQAAMDYHGLNEKRLQVLRNKEIVNDSLETLHSDAGDHIEQAVAARKQNQIAKAFAHEAFAMILGSRVTGPLKAIATDMVSAVVFLLILTIPFAFILERLFFSAVSIYRQVSGFVLFFIVTFGILYLVHPAFSLATAPVVIFLAFVIILMSALVIYFMVGKFKLEIRAMQGLSSTVHGASSDTSTAMAAVLIGISGMRNRPLKTALTAVTVVILTFTILVFASFTNKIGVRTTYVGKNTGVPRLELHRFSFLHIPDALVSSFRALYGEEWEIVTRQAAFRKPQREPHPPAHVVLNPGNKKWVQLDAMMSFAPRELSLNPELAALLEIPEKATGKRPPLYLPESIAETLQVKVGSVLKVRGQAFVYAGVFDAGRLGQMTNLDGSQITPPDFTSTNQQQQGADEKESTDTEGIDSSEHVDVNNFIYFPARTIGITVNGALDMIDGVTSFVALYPKGDADMDTTARQLAQVFHGPVLGNSPEGVNQYFFTSALESSGMSEVVVPLLLGGLIIFSSLLGSITDRSKEIFTYSALGLSPPDVGTLFFAESAVYAIVGGVGGYLLSQGVAALLALGGEYGLFHPPEMNFSSFASAMTILVVMATVMLSTIYPAMQAGKAANPGVARKWRMPAPAGDTIHFVFPFTVSERDMGGILAFIREHFGNHADSSLGSFAANDIHLFRTGEDASESFGIRARIALAPFDLGVSQSFDLYSKPSEIEGIDEVVVELNRISGTRGAWLRGNRDFISDLRNQFLYWRNLPVETVEHYRAESERVIKDEQGDTSNGA